MTRDRFGALDALFSIKSFGAAMLAYYIALRIGLPRPFWAIITSYIVSQPLAGAVLSKAVFRVLGTVLGAAAAVVLVPNLANAPELLSFGLACWLGLCVYLALLDRTPRSYVFLLAGYTAGIIGFPSVLAPGAIFDTAILRVQEIVLGIACASLVHGAVFPQTATARLIARVDAILRDAALWSADALADSPDENLHRDRRRLALDVFEIHQLSVHLPFDPARLLPRLAVVRALQDQISMILPLGAACLDRIERLGGLAALPKSVETLLEDARAWLVQQNPAVAQGRALSGRSIALVPQHVTTWHSALELNLMVRLAELVEAHAACLSLRQQLVAPHRRDRDAGMSAGFYGSGRRLLHRDHAAALRGAISVTFGVALICVFWIGAGWPDGGSAALLAGAVGAILVNLDARPEVGWRVLIGGLAGTALAFVYDFAILPRVTDFVPLIGVLAPAFLVMGTMISIPSMAPYALGMVLTLPTSMGLTDHYGSEAATFLNGDMAQLVAIGIPVLVLSLIGPASANKRARRLVTITRRELADRCVSRSAPGTALWLSTLLDRIAYLQPHAVGPDGPEDALDTMLVGARIGIGMDELRELRGTETDGRAAAAIDDVLRSLREHLQAGASAGAAEAGYRLRRQIDALLWTKTGARYGQDPDHRFALALVGLRCNLFPLASAPEIAA